MADPLEQLVDRLGARLPGVLVQWLPRVDSTSSELRRQLDTGLISGPALVGTDCQYGGRGTRGREWTQAAESAGQDLALTLAVPLSPQLRSEPRLSLLIGATVALAVEETCGQPVGVKWPNDILLSLAAGVWLKAGGLLLETLAARDGQRWLLCGVGLNVNSSAADFPPLLAPRIITLRDALGVTIDRAALHLAVAAALTGLLLSELESTAEPLMASWLARDKSAGTQYMLLRDGLRTPVAVSGVDRLSGALVVTLPDGSRTPVHSYTELEAIQ